MRVIVSCVLFAALAVGQNKKTVVGTWNGTLTVPGQKIPVVIHLRREKGGTLGATMDSRLQGVKGIAVTSAAFDADTRALSLELAPLRASYRGVLQDDGTIAGTWKQGGGQFPLNLKRGQGKLARPQQPRPPYPYKSEDVVFHHDDEGFLLAGTFTRPKDAAPHPAIILLSGSGPQDRNSSIAGHRPFHVIADALTRRGIAVLRVDDRGVGKSTGLFAGATTRDFATDARAAIHYLKTRADVDPKRIGLLGHSEGSTVAGIAAAGNRDVAFLVLLGGPGLSGRDVILKQRDLIAAKMGETAEMRAIHQRVQPLLYDIAESKMPVDDAMAKMSAVVARELADQTEAQRRALGYTDTMYAQITTVWFREFLRLDPRPYFQKVTCPVLVLNGEKDLQVDATQNTTALKAALIKNAKVTIDRRPNLNHLFQTCTTGSPTEYSQIEETFDPATLKAMGDWIQAHTAQPQPETK